MTFTLKILGSNSATPAYGRHHTSQLLNIEHHHFLIDCGEASQIQMQRFRCKPLRINHIFISHLHGDHYLGLMGLVFTMHLLGRKKDLHIYGQKGLDEIITLQLKYSDTRLNYSIRFHQLDPENEELIFEDNILTVTSFPLTHRIPCCGFLFSEKPKLRRMNKEKLPEKINISEIQRLKEGKDVMDENGYVKYAYKEYTLPPRKSRSYAYCSDTAYEPGIIPHIRNADVLYHEATFLNERRQWAEKTFHSTTTQAAEIARKANVGKLLIGHYSARYKDLTEFLREASEIFPKTILATEGETIEFKD
ncbi:MAG: ribonuclease Z [Cyclobacteriaceae bacterium]